MTTPTAPVPPSTPPRAAERLLAALGATPDLRDVFLGDLAEEHAIRALYDGDAAARRWYWREALRVAPYLLRDGVGGLRPRDAARLAAVVLGAWACATAFALGVAYMGWDLARLLRVEPGGPGDLPVLLAQNALAQLLGGYVAASLDRRRPLVAALAFGVAFAGVHLASLASGSHGAEWPAWVRVAQVALVVAAASLGGVLRVHARRGSPARGA